jgi:hypothetical protein
MIILKAIGSFFVKIWRWIKDTAWVQPLLIVGAIFAVIFSIPYITEWANNFTHNSTNSFYNASKKNLEGETNDKDSKSAADLLTNRHLQQTPCRSMMPKTAPRTSSDGDTSSLWRKILLHLSPIAPTRLQALQSKAGFKYPER